MTPDLRPASMVWVSRHSTPSFPIRLRHRVSENGSMGSRRLQKVSPVKYCSYVRPEQPHHAFVVSLYCDSTRMDSRYESFAQTVVQQRHTVGFGTICILTTIQAHGSLTYIWSPSSETGYDYLSFCFNGQRMDRLSGSGAEAVVWAHGGATVSGCRASTIKFHYQKYYSLSRYLDAGFGDQVSCVRSSLPASSGTQHGPQKNHPFGIIPRESSGSSDHRRRQNVDNQTGDSGEDHLPVPEPKTRR
jgi:hypothetical protein